MCARASNSVVTRIWWICGIVEVVDGSNVKMLARVGREGTSAPSASEMPFNRAHASNISRSAIQLLAVFFHQNLKRQVAQL